MSEHLAPFDLTLRVAAARHPFSSTPVMLPSLRVLSAQPAGLSGMLAEGAHSGKNPGKNRGSKGHSEAGSPMKACPTLPHDTQRDGFETLTAHQ